VKAAADELLSTGQMLKFARQSPSKEFIIATENGILHALRKDNPGKSFFPASRRAICPNMKRITLEKVLWSLEDMKHKVVVASDVAERARAALNRMIAVVPAR
jgi:quinolinate synthase